MIGYITLGTNDLDKAAAFYDALLAEIGAKRFMEVPDRFVAWNASENTPALSVTKPYDGNAATVGNGSMIALVTQSPEQVQALHARALELGGSDEGAPGERMPGFYGAYFRDLDGNKLCAFCRTPTE